MIKLSPEGEYHITGRGLVFVFKEVPSIKGIKALSIWMGLEVEVKGIRYIITGIEHHPVAENKPYKGPVGFLVKPL